LHSPYETTTCQNPGDSYGDENIMPSKIVGFEEQKVTEGGKYYLLKITVI
jgi:hypothetical protein